jgi:hypothetical protein
MYGQGIVTSHYVRQWQNGELTDAQLIATLFRKYQELVRDYERLQTKHNVVTETPPDRIRTTCEWRACGQVFYALSPRAKFCSTRCKKAAMHDRIGHW